MRKLCAFLAKTRRFGAFFGCESRPSFVRLRVLKEALSLGGGATGLTPPGLLWRPGPANDRKLNPSVSNSRPLNPTPPGRGKRSRSLPFRIHPG